MRQLRILGRVAIETLLSIKKSGWSSWLAVSILVIALTIFGGILQLTTSLKEIVDYWGTQLQISAYLNDSANAREVARLVSVIPEVKQVEIVPKEVAWQQMQSSFKVAAVNNPLPNTLHIQLVSSEAVEPAANEIKQIAGVEHVRYPLKVAKNINRFRHFLEAAGLTVTIALSAATLMVIGNTVQLVVQSRHREIEILSLMGVNSWYIKAPLVCLGATYGALSAALAVLLLIGIRFYMAAYVTGQLASYFPAMPQDIGYGMLPTFIVLLVIGVAVGAGGSGWCAGRYIKV
jgi:cell division transport system permease protein